MLKKTSTLIFTLFLSGCSIAPYSAPNTGDVAYLRTATSSSDYQLLGGFSGKIYGVGELDNDGCVGLRGHHPVQKESLNEDGLAVVKAGVPLSFQAMSYFGNNSCSVLVTATLKKDTQYNFTFNRNYKQCWIRLEEELDDGTTTLVETKRLYDNIIELCTRD